MAPKKTLSWGQTVYKDEMLLEAEDGNAVAHIFPTQGKGGFTLLTRDHAKDWNYEGKHCVSMFSAQHYALEHGKQYYEQEAQNQVEMSRTHLMLDVQTQWQQMGGNPRTMQAFKAEWDRANAADLKQKVPGPEVELDPDSELER